MLHSNKDLQVLYMGSQKMCPEIQDSRWPLYLKQEALLLQGDFKMRLWVEILQLWNILFEKDCN